LLRARLSALLWYFLPIRANHQASSLGKKGRSGPDKVGTGAASPQNAKTEAKEGKGRSNPSTLLRIKVRPYKGKNRNGGKRRKGAD